MLPKYVEVPVGRAAVKLIRKGDRICSHLDRGGLFEPQTLQRWSELCEHNNCVLDVGAYTGLFAIAAAILGADPIAFEPMAENAARLNINAKLNNVNIKVIQAAVSNKTGAIDLLHNSTVKGYTSGASIVMPSGNGGVRAPARRRVKALTIDSLKLKRCSAIKIDVERAEPMVLAGARATLHRFRPVLLVEVLGDAEKAAVRAAVPKYQVAEELDDRNWLMRPQ